MALGLQIDKSDELMEASQRAWRLEQLSISEAMDRKRSDKSYSTMGCPIIGVPKTIDNDLSATDFTFGFRTAVQIATESVDKLVTTAASHNRIMIMEVMGRDAGWIALHSAIAGGAEVCLDSGNSLRYQFCDEKNQCTIQER